MEVTVYSTPTCPFCKKVKEFLNEHDVDFTDINVAEDDEKAQEMIQKSGQMGVPVVEIDDEVIVGFDRDKLTETLDLE
jgi:glutaredoxin-like YruB-family protein